MINNETELNESIELHLILFPDKVFWIRLPSGQITKKLELITYPCEVSMDKYPPIDWLMHGFELYSDIKDNPELFWTWFHVLTNQIIEIMKPPTMEIAFKTIKEFYYDK